MSIEDVWLLLLTQGTVIDEEASPKHWLVIAALVQMFVAVVCWSKAPAQEGKMKGLEHGVCTQSNTFLHMCVGA